jgi:hypothetical protein
MSLLTPTKVFVPRYLLPSASGLALLAGWAVSCAPRLGRRFFAAGIAAVAILNTQGGLRAVSHGSDYRVALGAVNRAASVAGDPVPVLFRVGFSETAYVDWTSPRERATPYFSAALDAYPLDVKPVLLPYRASASAFTYLSELTPQLQESPRLLLLTNGDFSYELWLMGRLSESGFVRGKTVYFDESLRLVWFEKAPPAALERKERR